MTVNKSAIKSWEVSDAEVKYFETKEEFAPEEFLKEGDTVLIKASNGMKFKEIVEKLSE